MKLQRNAVGWPHIDARLDRQHHAGPQDTGRAIDDGLATECVLALAGLAQFGWLEVSTTIMHIHAQPVAGAVHVELKISPLVDHIVQRADLVAIEQAQVEHALGQHLDTGFVRIGETGATARGGDGRLLTHSI